MNQYFIGDDISIDFPLTSNSLVNMDLSGSTITAAIVSADGSLAPGVTPFSVSPPVFRTGRLPLVIPRSITALLASGIYSLEVQSLEDGYRLTYDRFPFRMIPGAIGGIVPPPPTPSSSQFDFNNPDNAGMLAILF